MGTVGNPKPWVPYVDTKDCSQGFCSSYCPQWCYIIFPPPPPFRFPDENSGPNFSPLVIAIIGILASAFLLVSYYAVISKYCGNMDSARRRESQDSNVELEENQDPSNHEPWHAPTNGLDEALIKSITVCKYKKGDGLIDGPDCSVCLSEFQEDESLRLLPKCSHAFHVKCIDTWLRSHSNCPLCRANIIFINPLPLQLPHPPAEVPLNYEISLRSHRENANVAAVEDIQANVQDEVRAVSDLGYSVPGDAVIEIGDEEDHRIRRSVSMSYACQSRVSISDILRVNQDEEVQPKGDIGSSERPGEEMSKPSHRNRVLHCVMSPVSMKRSFSGGRFSFARHGSRQNLVISL
ncbi:hypothetical protein RJ639_024059 [Escallonia herrerae]|uniref:RING-type E3 ubiquitin transferase n=1 Tax=Escallonia herrerae TaxID=1293975 RepID=A0AA88UYH2_9ASTE|nr:hypothetical protein RJ639_024059 [Escallonia herrerae]